MPMFLRVFVATVATVSVVPVAVRQHRRRLPGSRHRLDAGAALGRGDPRGGAAGAGERTRRTVQIAVEVLGGEPPARAAELTRDGRTTALVRALAEAGIEVQQARLDDTADPPVTWLRIAQGDGVSRWTGIVGGLQPSNYRRRLLARARHG
jgi:hypothetical protein